MLKDLPTEKINRVFSLLSFVPMPKGEKHMWMIALKEMNEKQLDKLIEILAKQAEKMTEISMKVLEKKVTND